MKTNKLDNNIKEKLQNRTFEPSASAWERLSTKLDEQPKQKKKGWFFYIGYAASILALISIGFYTFSGDKKSKIPNVIIVEGVIDTTQILNKIEQHFKEVPVERAVVETVKKEVYKIEKQQEKNVAINVKKAVVLLKKESYKIEDNTNNSNNKNITIAEKLEGNSIIIPEVKKSRIKVNVDDLLYAVTNTSEEQEKQYTKNNVSREDILKTIKSELKKSNLKVNPETILAEVERTIGDDDFQNNFLKSLKKKITNIATAIASRND